MSLDPNILKQSFLDLGTNYPKDLYESAVRRAQAYATYASDARTVSGNAPVSLAAAQETLTGALVPAFTGYGRGPENVANAIAGAFTAFWFVPPVVTAGSFPGTVTAVTGTQALVEALVNTWEANVRGRVDRDTAAGRLADVFDKFTKTVIVTEVPGVGPPIVGPIS